MGTKPNYTSSSSKFDMLCGFDRDSIGSLDANGWLQDATME